MYVIFPADELILMTYGAAIPRHKPRPTLDCLREPQVPIGFCSNTITPVTAITTTTDGNTYYNNANIAVATPAEATESITANSVQTNIVAYDNLRPLPTFEKAQNAITQSLPPTPTRITARTHLTRSTPNSFKRDSLQSIRAPQATPAAQPQQISLQANNKTNSVPNKLPMYNDTNMSNTPPQQQQQAQSTGTRRPTLTRSSAIRSATPVRANTPQRSFDTYYANDSRSDMGATYSGAPSMEYPTGLLNSARERSPSIFLEPPSPDPTQLTIGPGWGRPMSPMDLPPPPKSPPNSTKSRLRPKLHIPLGRLGRSTSTEQRESQRLKEDLQLHVENPIFNSENLRQRNFDAFFESGEPVYKLQPKTPNSAPSETASLSTNYSPILGNHSSASSSGGLFARTPREEKALAARSKSAEVYESPREARATSVGGGVPQKDFSGKSSSGQKSRSFFGWRGPRGGSLSPQASMASYNGVLKDYGHNNLNEAFKSQNNVNFKLIKTVSDFTETLSQLYEEHATALQTLVSNYRKKNAELRKERPACHLAIFQAWETFLQEVETDSQASNDVASVLSRQVSRPMLDKSFHRKVQSRKIFTHRESFETIIAKTEEKLSKCRLDYKQCYMAHRQNPTQLSLTEYIDAHNAYVQQLHATNAMLEQYHCETVPQLMQELEEIHNDLCSIIADSILQGVDIIANKASDQAKRYGNLTIQCNSVSPTQDLTNFVRILPLPSQAQKVPRRVFAPPQPPSEVNDAGDLNEITPILRNELVFDRHSTLSLRPALESLKREAIDLEMQIRQLQDSIEVLNRTQSRGIEGQLYNKVNELQEDLSMKKFDLRAKQIHLAAIRAQKDLFVSKVDPGSPRVERKLPAASAPSMKTKWLKAFKSLKPASGSAAQADRRNGASGTSAQPLRPNEDGSHHLQEYTYKKITACDVCSQILRGHTRQGLRCRICKLNSHGDCASQLPRCQPKQKLLRRQKSTSELENRVDIEEEIADMGTKIARPFGEPLMLNKKILKNSSTGSNAGSIETASTTAGVNNVKSVTVATKTTTNLSTTASNDGSKPKRKIRLK